MSVWQTGGATQFTAVVRNITERKRGEAELQRLGDEIQLQRLRVFKATMRTVQDIVNNLLNGLQLVQIEAEGQLSDEMLALLDSMTLDAAGEGQGTGRPRVVHEKDMAIGSGIDYPGAPS